MAAVETKVFNEGETYELVFFMLKDMGIFHASIYYNHPEWGGYLDCDSSMHSINREGLRAACAELAQQIITSDTYHVNALDVIRDVVERWG